MGFGGCFGSGFVIGGFGFGPGFVMAMMGFLVSNGEFLAAMTCCRHNYTDAHPRISRGGQHDVAVDAGNTNAMVRCR
jgi:hypothetical protein